MGDERLRTLLARISENHRRAHALLDEARRVVGLAADTVDAIRRRRVRDHATTVADLREVAQRAREVMEERRELLEQLAAHTGRTT